MLNPLVLKLKWCTCQVWKLKHFFFKCFEFILDDSLLKLEPVSHLLPKQFYADIVFLEIIIAPANLLYTMYFAYNCSLKFKNSEVTGCNLHVAVLREAMCWDEITDTDSLRTETGQCNCFNEYFYVV